MPRRAPSRPSPKFYLFERCSGGILNLRFDSQILESFYSKCSYPRATGRFRFGTAFIAVTCLIWLIYFCILQPILWKYYVYSLACAVTVSITCFGISFCKKFFKKHCLWFSGIYALVCCVLVLLPFAVKDPSASLAFNLNLCIQLIVLIYTMIPLRLWHLLLLCGPLSVIQIALASTRYGRIGGSLILIHIVAHICVHTIGIILHLMSQVWRRSTFLRLGYNALMRKELRKEQEIRDDMIRSLMPAEVAQEVMREVGHEGGMDDLDVDLDGDSGRGKVRMSQSEKDKKDDELAMGSFGFSGEFDEEEEEEGATKKLSTASYPEMDGPAVPPSGDAEAVALGPDDSPRGSLVDKLATIPRAVAFRKFHVSQLENVSVLFADIVGFTKMSSNKTASQLVYLLNDLFGRFDRLCEISGCEKIATLGDCYYCVAGCPNLVVDHAERAVEMGRAMCRAIQQFDEDHKEEVNMRVGVHTGKVICGLVGTRRFKFDVWSNDVTLANEMESSGQAGKVHISEATHEFVKDIYEVSDGESVPDIRKFKVLVEFFNKEEQCFAIKHTQDEAMIKTYFIEKRLDGKPVYTLKPEEVLAGMNGKPVAPESPTTASAHPIDTTSNGDDDKLQQQPAHATSIVAAATEQRVSLVDQKPMDAITQGSDTEMLDALQTFASEDDVFAFPPISRITLNFRDARVEHCYRILGLGRPRGKAITKLSWSTPRVAPLINTIIELSIFVVVLITCLIAFPDSRGATYTVTFYIVAFIAVVIHIIFIALLFTDLAAWGCRCSSKNGVKSSPKTPSGWRVLALRAYAICFRWPIRNVIGAIVLILPTAVILSNFNGSFFGGSDQVPSLFIAHYRLLIGLLYVLMLFNFTLYSSFSFWTKTLSAAVSCLIAILTLALTAVSFAPLPRVFEEAWNTDPAYWDVKPVYAWVATVLRSTFPWEIGLILSLTFVLVVALNREFDISFRLSFHRDYEAMQAKRAIAQQKSQADWLLENIIPFYIMDDLRRTNKYSQHIVDAGVVFSTISNFAEFYDEQYQGGQEMLRVLNELFADFEHLLALPSYKDVEKIKTIGACFMAASGLNMAERKRNRRPDAHLWELMDFSLELIHTLDDFNRQMFNFQFEMKVGYNVGEVTAGVIGTTKLLYDIWGDTVNVASRMYSTGHKGRIQVTEAVANRLESRYVFEYRGEVFVKGKGDMKIYLLVGRRTE